MSGFDDRERAYEEKFSHDQEVEFKAAARRDTLVGLWAAEQLGMDGADAKAYARSIVNLDIERKGSDVVRDKIHADLEAASVEISTYLVEKKMEECLAEARREIMSGE